jgi:hypothetical protein
MSARLPTALWVQAHTARCSAAGIPMVVVRRGDPDRGVVVAKLYRPGQGVRVVTQTRDLDGEFVWSPALEGEIVPDSDADDFIARQIAYDPDLWVIEVEIREQEDWFCGVVV